MSIKADQAEPAAQQSIGWGSDVIAEMLRRLGIKYVCLNPGSSFRGLHDSLVNYLGNDQPTLLLALHEQSVVAIAHGYAKAAGEPMAAILHSNVGLMCGTMSIFNAWCDRTPMLILGATGAVDSAVRRSWIDWNHTLRDQGALVRHYVKWDDQPASPQASVDSLLRAYQRAVTPPCGPAYVILDRRLQEDALASPVTLPDVARYASPQAGIASEEALRQAATWLGAAKHPAILMGRLSRKQPDWDARIRLAELLGARVITDLRTGATFPTEHPAHGGPADLFLSPANGAILRQSDVILSLDWPDLADTLQQAHGNVPSEAKIIQISVDHHGHNGYSGDHQRLVAADLSIAVPPDDLVTALVAALEAAGTARHQPLPARPEQPAEARGFSGDMPTLADIGRALSTLREGRALCLARVPLNWPAGSYQFRAPLDYLGYDGGGGVGSGPGMTVGAGLALAGSGRIVVGIMGDGEFLGAPSALWTAAHYRIPALFVIANNRSYFTDEIQQEAVAQHRDRPVANRWIGQRIDEPAINLAGLARDYGVEAEGPVARASDLPGALARGLAAVEAGRPYLIDVRIDPTRGGNFDWLATH